MKPYWANRPIVPDGPKAEASWDVKITISRNGFPTFPLLVRCCHCIQPKMAHYRAARVSQKRARSVVMNLFSASVARAHQLNSLIRPSGSCFSSLSVDLLSGGCGRSRSYSEPETEFVVIQIIIPAIQLMIAWVIASSQIKIMDVSRQIRTECQSQFAF